jgi:hypothetical protein
MVYMVYHVHGSMLLKVNGTMVYTVYMVYQ